MTKRYGIAEWYGHDFASLSPKEIRSLAQQTPRPCPFRFPTGLCTKAGGVCSIRLYSEVNGKVTTADQELVTTCPNRFVSSGQIFESVAKRLIGTNRPHVATEIPFLLAQGDDNKTRAVGKIDMVLVDPDTQPLQWCALEMQAVYFSGPAMSSEFDRMKGWDKLSIPFPAGTRRPDFRSSGPKRLMPQLQTKVPTISRWGKKTAVVVDRAFWSAMAPMDVVDEMTNGDIAWFIVDYARGTDGFQSRISEVVYTTLDSAVKGLTGGKPTSLAVFEEKILTKVADSGLRVNARQSPTD